MDKSTGYESAPPAYSDVMSNTNVMPTVHTSARQIETTNPYVSQYPAGMGVGVTTENVNYHPAPAPGFVVTQPINSMPQVGYGTISSGPTYQLPQTVVIGIPGDIRMVGGCSVCRIGVLEDNYPVCAICCAIVFFPLGILFCIAMRNKRCSHCGVEF